MPRMLSSLVLSLLLLAGSMPLQAQEPLLDQIRDRVVNGDLTAALIELENFLADSPDHREARFLKGLTLARMDDIDGAIAVFRHIIADYPELPEPYNNLAVLYAGQGDYDRARDALVAAINTHPSYAVAHENLGDLYAKMAADAYDRALALDGGNNTARAKLSLVSDLFSQQPPGTSSQSNAGSSTTTAPAISSTTTDSQTTPPAQVASTTPEPVAEPVLPDAESPPDVQSGPATAAVDPSTRPIARPAVDQDAVSDAVRDWAAAWSAQDIQGYLTSYSERFRPAQGLSRTRWREQRRERIARPQFIDVQIENLTINVQNPQRASATFDQVYRSNSYRDRVSKTLEMVLESGGWKILSEQSAG